MGRLAPDSRPIAADILRGRSSSPQLCTTEEASFISKAASHQCSLWPARFSLSENRHPSEFCARNSKRSIWQDPSGKKVGREVTNSSRRASAPWGDPSHGSAQNKPRSVIWEKGSICCPVHSCAEQPNHHFSNSGLMGS